VPKDPDHVPVVIVPTDVNEDAVTVDPKMVDDNTDVLLILNTLPDAKFQFSEDVQLVFVLSQIIVLSVAPFNVIPPPFAVASVGVVTEPNSIFLSSTDNIVELITVFVPLTVKSPVTVKLDAVAAPIVVILVDPAHVDNAVFSTFPSPTAVLSRVIHVLLPARYVVALAVPVPRRAVPTVPELRLDAFKLVKLAPEPLKPVDVNNPVLGLNVNLVDDTSIVDTVPDVVVANVG